MRKPNQTAPEVIDRRRALVAEMVSKGATIREMTRVLADRGEVNPATKSSWDNATIGRDVIHLREAWKAQANQTILDHKARLLAEINAVKRAAWKTNDHRVILDSIKSERQLLGLDAPLSIQTQNHMRIASDHLTISDDKIAERILEILTEAESRKELDESRESVEGQEITVHPLYPAA